MDQMTVEQITQQYREGKIDADTMLALIAEVKRKPPKFEVAVKSGWLSIYFDGLRFPCSMPYECAVALFKQETVEAARKYLEVNEARFTKYADRKKK